MADRRIVESPEWGRLEITVNSRARRIIMRAAHNAIRITVPPHANAKDIENALYRHGSSLKEQQKTLAHETIDTAFTIKGDNFNFNITEYNGTKFILEYRGNSVTLKCPAGTDYGKKQEWLRQAAKTALKKIAAKVLPARLHELAQEHGLSYNRCGVRDTRTHWGSCNSKGNISLSIYTALLPARLMDYILLHELCHTRHMNHGPQFWEFLDRLCGTDSKTVRQQLKAFKTTI